MGRRFEASSKFIPASWSATHRIFPCVMFHDYSEDFQEHPTQASDQPQIYFYLAAMGDAVNVQWKEKRREQQLKCVKAMGIGNIIHKAGSGCL